MKIQFLYVSLHILFIIKYGEYYIDKLIAEWKFREHKNLC